MSRKMIFSVLSLFLPLYCREPETVLEKSSEPALLKSTYYLLPSVMEEYRYSDSTMFQKFYIQSISDNQVRFSFVTQRKNCRDTISGIARKIKSIIPKKNYDSPSLENSWRESSLAILGGCLLEVKSKGEWIQITTTGCENKNNEGCGLNSVSTLVRHEP